jgi:hypothetical protein
MTRRRTAALLGTGLALVLAVSACSSGGGSSGSATRAPATPATGAVACIENEQGTGCLPVRPESERVDLGVPSFSNPTNVTNPLFKKSGLTQVIQLGGEGGDRLRFEVTQLPEPRVVEWNGQRIPTRVTHFVAYTNGRLTEVANDFYAQADDGSVWYFGETVDNYENGVLANHDGAWLAGKDGPPGLIMPGKPQVGDVYRPENIPGAVFEEVVVKAVGQIVAGPRGPVPGAIRIQAQLMDATVEEKVFAPGYGEFQGKVASLDELYHVALAAPTDTLAGPVPAALTTLSTGAASVFDSSAAERWDRVAATLATMTAAWSDYRAGDVPKLLATQTTGALDSLARAVKARDPAATRQAALEVTQASLDLQLQHRPAAEVDLARLDMWARQLLVDAAAKDRAAVAGDVATLRTIWERMRHTVAPAQAERVAARLDALRAAAGKRDLDAVARAVTALRAALAGVSPSSG